MKIWVIGRSYPTPSNKMRGSFELEQAQLLAGHGHDVTYLAAVLHPINKIKKWGLVRFQSDTIPVFAYSIPFAPERMHLHPAFLLNRMWRKLFQEAEAAGGLPDIIHIHYPGMNCVPDIARSYRERGCKIVTTDHWTKTLTDSMDRFQRAQLIAFSQVADEILCVGETLKTAIYRITKTEKPITVVPNVVSHLFSPEKDKSGRSEYRFIAVGRLAPVKQVDQIVQAFCEEFKHDADVSLTVVGGGNELKKIQAIIAQHALQDRIRLTGSLNREATAAQVSQSDCLVCFSRLETFGVPVIEAWACGKPVIGTDALGCLEDWSEDLGVVVSHNSRDELKAAMRKMVAERHRFDADRISRYAVECFSEEAIYNRLLQIYQRPVY